MANEKFNIENISPDKFEFVANNDFIHDQKFETKPVGYMKDAMRRFVKNKSSVFAAVIILILVMFAIIGPYSVDSGYQASYQTDTTLKYYKELPPRVEGLIGTGFWDGSKKEEVSEARYIILKAMEVETGYNAIQEVYERKEIVDAFGKTSVLYTIRRDLYYSNPAFNLTLTRDQYEDIQKWQDENGIQVILPRVNAEKAPITTYGETNIWFISDQKGRPVYDSNNNLQPAYFRDKDKPVSAGSAIIYSDDYHSMRLAGDPGIDDPTSAERYHYAHRTGSDGKYNYVVRVASYNYFIYKHGFEPCFTFGSDTSGYDILSRLAAGARFSLLLALLVSVVNLTIGAIYGAIEGYYGGVVDLAMERFSDILSGIPFMVVTVLFKLHLADDVGLVGALIYSFILTGWIGMASRVRMQFYRFKNQEYVLAARTLGASDKRIIWKHIFPNSLGTIITGSVLVIPGVIFSETSLSYLGIINLDSNTMSSVGSMLSAGQSVMTTAPHVVLFPALFIALLEICFNLFGNGLRDAFNPSLRGSEG